MTNNVFPKISLESQLLYDRLQQANIGEIITYEELSSLVGRNVQTEAYGCLYTARRKARSVDFKTFGTIPKVGVKCLEDAEIVAKAIDLTDRCRSRTRDGLKTMVCLKDYNSLPEGLKLKYNTVGTLLLMMNRITSPKEVRKLEEAVSQKAAKLTFTQTLELFGSK